MASLNKVMVIGNLTRDIELRYTSGGTAVAEMGLAVNDRRKNQQGEWVDETTFIDVVLWSRTAENASEYLSKGSPVFVEGRLKLDTWEKDGQKHYKMRVVCERLQFLNRGNGEGQQRSSRGSTRQPQGGGYDDFGGGADEDVPF